MQRLHEIIQKRTKPHSSNQRPFSQFAKSEGVEGGGSDLVGESHTGSEENITSHMEIDTELEVAIGKAGESIVESANSKSIFYTYFLCREQPWPSV